MHCGRRRWPVNFAREEGHCRGPSPGRRRRARIHTTDRCATDLNGQAGDKISHIEGWRGYGGPEENAVRPAEGWPVAEAHRPPRLPGRAISMSHPRPRPDTTTPLETVAPLPPRPAERRANPLK